MAARPLTLADVHRWQASEPARGLLLGGCTVGYLVLLAGPRVSALDWVLALGAVAAAAVGARWTLAVALAQPGLLAVAEVAGTATPVTIKVAASLAVFELAARRRGIQPLIGFAALAAVYLGKVALPGSATPLPTRLYEIAVVVAGPALLGGYLRSARDSARHARQRLLADQRRQLAEVRAAQATGRAAIARELHDLVAHHVASIVLRAGVVRHVGLAADPRVHEALEDIHATGTTAMADLRRLVVLLRDTAGTDARPAPPGLGELLGAELPAAVAAAVDRGRRLGLTVDSELDPAVGTLDPARGLAVLRLVQEGLANVARHAGPVARAELHVAVAADGAVRLELHNDLPESAATGEPGHGLAGMRERVELLGGRFEAGPVGGRWRLSARLPAVPDAAGATEPSGAAVAP